MKTNFKSIPAMIALAELVSAAARNALESGDPADLGEGFPVEVVAGLKEVLLDCRISYECRSAAYVAALAVHSWFDAATTSLAQGRPRQ